MRVRMRGRAKSQQMKASRNNDDLAVHVQDVSRNETVPSPDRVEGWVKSVFEAGRRGELTVRIVDEPEGAALNERFRQGNGATNVLAFPAAEPLVPAQVDPPPIGDLVICAPVLEREARAQNKSLEAHWAHIAIHGAEKTGRVAIDGNQMAGDDHLEIQGGVSADWAIGDVIVLAGTSFNAGGDNDLNERFHDEILEITGIGADGISFRNLDTGENVLRFDHETPEGFGFDIHAVNLSRSITFTSAQGTDTFNTPCSGQSTRGIRA